MVFNEKMDQKLSDLILKWKNASKIKMFGGTGYLIDGKMVAGIYKDSYILRLGEKNAKRALNIPKISPLDITGRPMKGWIMAPEDAFSSNEDFIKWLNEAKNFVDSLPSKK